MTEWIFNAVLGNLFYQRLSETTLEGHLPIHYRGRDFINQIVVFAQLKFLRLVFVPTKLNVISDPRFYL